MTADLLMALVVFAFVTSITPGPNNLMLLASGVNYGFVRSLPHMLGVGLGFGFMILAVGLGLSTMFEAYPLLHTALRTTGVAYMLYLAWKIGRSGPVGEGRSSGRPMTFLGAAAFQWVNPKAWIMAVSVIATYTLPHNYIWTLLMVSLVFVDVNIPSIAWWVAFGKGMRRFLNDRRYLRVFNITMAVMLVVSLAPILWH
jgi:threonine/homoserine/homoserine lactone efflux protein